MTASGAVAGVHQIVTKRPRSGTVAGAEFVERWPREFTFTEVRPWSASHLPMCAGGSGLCLSMRGVTIRLPDAVTNCRISR